MLGRLITILPLLSMLLLVPATSQAKLPLKQRKALEKPVRMLVSAVRYGKDDLALKQLAGEAQGEALLLKAWETASKTDRVLFVARFQGLFAALAFPKLRKNFKHLETIVYDKHSVNPKHSDRASLESTLVILHPLKKQEIRVRYELLREGKTWKVKDVGVLGAGRPSMLVGIRDDQVQPLLKAGDLASLLAQMKTRLDEARPAATQEAATPSFAPNSASK